MTPYPIVPGTTQTCQSQEEEVKRTVCLSDNESDSHPATPKTQKCISIENDLHSELCQQTLLNKTLKNIVGKLRVEIKGPHTPA
jgi:hypothetical protein